MWRYVNQKTERKEKGFKLEEFAHAILDELWNRSKIIFHDGIEELYSELQYIARQYGIIEIQDSDKLEENIIKIRDIKKLEEMANKTRDFADLSPVPLLKEYLKRIDDVFSGN
jgi:hypothetical protein